MGKIKAGELTSGPVSPGGLSAIDIVAQYFPGEDAAYLESIAWGETGYPCFWNIPEDGATPLECFTIQVARAAARENFGFFGYYDGERCLAAVRQQVAS